MGKRRRLIAYLILAATMIISVVAMATPVFTKLNAGREYTSGNEFVYQLRVKDAQDDEDAEVEDKDAAEEVATEMRARLETYQVEDYSVVVQGNDTIRVSITENDETQLNNIRKYLAFSGGDFSLSGKNEETRISHNDVFKDSKAYIVRQNDLVPYVIIPVSDPSKVKTLIDTVGGSSGETKGKLNPFRAAEGEEEEKSEPDIFLWANWVDGDTYEKAQSDQAVTGQKIVAQFVSKNIWYTESKEEQTELQYLCGFADSEGNYDATKLKQANQLAIFLTNLFNASSYDYEVVDLFVAQSASGVTYNPIRTNPTVEQILVYGTDVNLAMKATLVSAIIAIIVISFMLAFFYRLTAVAMVANTVSTVFLTYVLFTAMSATFNVAAFVAGVLLTITSLVTEIVYATKFKEEVYKGRSMKKANQEAIKKTSLIALDIAIPTLISGILLYFLGGNALRPMGIVLFFGGVISLLMTVLVFRLLTYLLTNSTNLMTAYNAFNIDEELVVKPTDPEDKEVYDGPYKDRDFTKKKKVSFIVMAVLFVASLAGGIVFSAIDGSALNVSNATKDNTEIYLSIRDDHPDIDTEDKFKEDVLKNVYIGDKALAYQSVEMETREEYNYETTVTTKYTYFITHIDGKVPAGTISYKVGDVMTEVESIDEAIETLVNNIELISDEDIVSRTKISHETVKTPHQGYIMLASIIALVASVIYYAFRYRPSKALAAGAISLSATTITFGVLTLTRIQTLSLTALSIPVIMLVSLLLTIFYLNKAKDYYLDERDLTLEKRRELSVEAISSTAAPLFISVIIFAFIGIAFFGFGPLSYSHIFASLVFGVAVSGFFIVTTIAPITNFFEKLFSKIKLPERKKTKKSHKREKIKLQRKNSSEPQETIFIGIND